MYYYHFCKNDFRTKYTDEKIKVNKTLYYPGDLKPCFRGLHACPRIIDALSYAPGTILCKVELGSTVITFGDKVVSNSRKVIAARNIKRELISFTQWCELRVKKYDDDAADTLNATYTANAADTAHTAFIAHAVYAAKDAACAARVHNAYALERELQEEWLQRAIALWESN